MTLDLAKPLSPAMLERAHACPEAVATCRRLFGPRPRKLTRALLRQAAGAGLDVDWLAQYLPAPARAAYDEAAATALADALGLP